MPPPAVTYASTCTLPKQNCELLTRAIAFDHFYFWKNFWGYIVICRLTYHLICRNMKILMLPWFIVILFVSLIFNNSAIVENNCWKQFQQFSTSLLFSVLYTQTSETENKCIYYYNIVLYISDSVNNSCIIRYPVMFSSSPLPCLICSLTLSLCSITVPLKSVINRYQGRRFNSNSVFQKYLFHISLLIHAHNWWKAILVFTAQSRMNWTSKKMHLSKNSLCNKLWTCSDNQKFTDAYKELI